MYCFGSSAENKGRFQEGRFIAASGLDDTLNTTSGFPRRTSLTMTTSTIDLGC